MKFQPTLWMKLVISHKAKILQENWKFAYITDFFLQGTYNFLLVYTGNKLFIDFSIYFALTKNILPYRTGLYVWECMGMYNVCYAEYKN